MTVAHFTGKPKYLAIRTWPLSCKAVTLQGPAPDDEDDAGPPRSRQRDEVSPREPSKVIWSSAWLGFRLRAAFDPNLARRFVGSVILELGGQLVADMAPGVVVVDRDQTRISVEIDDFLRIPQMRHSDGIFDYLPRARTIRQNGQISLQSDGGAVRGERHNMKRVGMLWLAALVLPSQAFKTKDMGCRPFWRLGDQGRHSLRQNGRRRARTGRIGASANFAGYDDASIGERLDEFRDKARHPDFADNDNASVERLFQGAEHLGEWRGGFFQFVGSTFQIVRRRFSLGLICGQAGRLRLRNLDIETEQRIFQRRGMNFGATDSIFGGGQLPFGDGRERRLDGVMSGAAKIVLRLLEPVGEINPGLPAIVEGLLRGTFEWVFHERNMRPFDGRLQVQTSNLCSLAVNLWLYPPAAADLGPQPWII